MTPFQEFRLWARRAPASERIFAGLAAAVVLALLAWLVVPGGVDSSDELVNAGTGVPEAGTGDGGEDLGDQPSGDGNTQDPGGDAELSGPANGASDSSRAGGGDPAGPGGGSPDPSASASGGGSAQGTQGGCTSPPGGGRGISDSEVKVAVPLVALAGAAGNELFGIDSPDEQKAVYEAVLAGINRAGGVACRDLVAQYWEVNPADESQMMGVCRDIVDADVFAVADPGSMATRPNVLACFGQNKVPYFGAYFITETLRQRFFPYLYAFYTKELVYKDTAFGLRDLGFFDPAEGFEKLGFIFRSCERQSIASFRGWLHEAGVSDNQMVPYDVGCPSAFASPADLQQAVLTFQREGVTHVTTGNFQGDTPTFTNIAEQQGFRPQYGFPDEALLSVAEGSQAPNPDNIANAIAVTTSRQAEQNTPGMTPSAGTVRCDRYFRAAGMPPTWEQAAASGNTCSQLWMIKAAIENAPELHVGALPAGLQRAKSVEFSFPQAPNAFSGDKVTTGGQFWRPAQFNTGCECWRVLDPEFRPSF